MMWTVGKEHGPKHIVMLIRPPRAKNYRLICFCKRRRTDGTCLLTDGIRPLVYTRARHRIRLEHPQIDERLDRLPDPDTRAYPLTEAGRAAVEAAA